MVVAYNDIINAIARAEDVALYNARARAVELSNGCKPSKEDDDKAIEIESWIQLLTRAAANYDHETCLTDDIIWDIIQNVNEQNRDVDCDVSRTYSRNASSGGGSNVPSGYVERVLGLYVDNTNPSLPVIEIFVDGVTITGDGTQANPFVAVAGLGTVVSVNGFSGVVTLTTANIPENTNLYYTNSRGIGSILTGLSISGGAVVATDSILQAIGKLQNQINGAMTNPMTMGGDIIYGGTSGVPTRLANGTAGQILQSNGTTLAPSWATITAGNANITPITVTVLQNLRSTSALSTTTLYNVTNAVSSTLVLQVYAIANNTNVVYAIDVATGAIGTYNITTDAFTVAVPDLQQVTTAGATTTVGLTVDNGTDSVIIQPNQIKIANGTGYGTIAAANLTADPNFELPNKVSGTYTFAMLSDITSGGDVVGPASAVSNNVVFFNGTTGKLIKDSGLSLSGTNTGNETTSTLGATINGAAAATPNDTDLVATVESSVVKKITWTNVKAFLSTYFNGIYQAILTAANMHTFVDSLNTMTTPADADRLLIVDNSASLAKKITWANIKATLSSTFLPLTGGSLSGALNESKGADIASAATTDIGAATGNYVVVTGTTTITALGTVQAGTRRIVNFSGILTLTHNATSLILPTAANITTAAGDTSTFVSLGSGNWVCVNYMRASGAALVGGGGSFIATLVTGGTAVTGTTASTFSGGVLVPANTFVDGDCPFAICRCAKTGGNNTITMRFYVNTANSLSGSPILMGTSSALAASTLTTGISRTMAIEEAGPTSPITTVVNTTAAMQFDLTTGGSAQSSLAIDWTVDQYIIVAIQNASTADSSIVRMLKVTKQ